MESKKQSKIYELSWYVNPHMFWLRSQQIPTDVLVMEENLKKHYRHMRTLQNRKFKPEIGDMVAYYNQPSDHWYRAVIDYHFNLYNKQSEHYIIWLIDFGYPIHVTNLSLRPLDGRFRAQKLQGDVIKVGVSDILPASEEYDYILDYTYLGKSEKWDGFVLRKFKEVLENASFIKIKAECRVKDHYFGKVMVCDQEGEIDDACDILASTKQALKTSDDENFLHELDKAKTIKFERFHDNNGVIIRPPLQPIVRYPKDRKKDIANQATKLVQMQTVKVVEGFDDLGENDIPKNIPTEM